MRSLGNTWKSEHCLPKFTIAFKNKDGTAHDEKMAVGIQLHHEDYDFVYDTGVENAECPTNHFMFEMLPNELGVNVWDESCWRIEPKRRDGSSLGRDEVETGKEIDVLVTMFYDDSRTRNRIPGIADRGGQMGAPKSFKCVVGPGEPISMKLIVPHNNDGDNTITITNGSSLEGRGLNVMNELALTPHPLTYPIHLPSQYSLLL